VCSHCHGPDGVGSTFAPSLIDRLVDYDAFREVVLGGGVGGASQCGGSPTIQMSLPISARSTPTSGRVPTARSGAAALPTRNRERAAPSDTYSILIDAVLAILVLFSVRMII
jgi:hypothetical protein